MLGKWSLLLLLVFWWGGHSFVISSLSTLSISFRWLFMRTSIKVTASRLIDITSAIVFMVAPSVLWLGYWG
jgi:hypothetical protein